MDNRCCCLEVDHDDDTATDKNEHGTGENAIVNDAARMRGTTSSSDFIVLLVILFYEFPIWFGLKKGVIEFLAFS